MTNVASMAGAQMDPASVTMDSMGGTVLLSAVQIHVEQEWIEESASRLQTIMQIAPMTDREVTNHPTPADANKVGREEIALLPLNQVARMGLTTTTMVWSTVQIQIVANHKLVNQLHSV